MERLCSDYMGPTGWPNHYGVPSFFGQPFLEGRGPWRNHCHSFGPRLSPKGVGLGRYSPR